MKLPRAFPFVILARRRHSARRLGTQASSSSLATVEAVDDFLIAAVNKLGLGFSFQAASLSGLAMVFL